MKNKWIVLFTGLAVLGSVGCGRVRFSNSGGAGARADGKALKDLEVRALSDGATLEIDHKNKVAYLNTVIKTALLKSTPSLTFLGEMPYSPDIRRSCNFIRETVAKGNPIYSTLLNHRAGFYYFRAEEKSDFIKQAKFILNAMGLAYPVYRKPIQFNVVAMAEPSLILSGAHPGRGLKVLLSVLGNGAVDNVSFGLTIGELCDLISEKTTFTAGPSGDRVSIGLDR